MNESDVKKLMVRKPNGCLEEQWFNTDCAIERPCYERGHHRWGRDMFADEVGVQGYHKCLDCYRCEPS